MKPSTFELSLEQQFHLQTIQVAAAGMERGELEAALAQLVRLQLVKDNIIKDLIKNAGISHA